MGFSSFFMLLLWGCHPKGLLKALDGTHFSDEVIFLSSSTLRTSYSYNFQNGHYTKFAKNNQSGEMKVFEAESGLYKLKGDIVTLSPEKKRCYSITSESYISFESSGFDENDMIYLHKDTLSEKQIINLGFTPRSFRLEQTERGIELQGIAPEISDLQKNYRLQQSPES